MSAPVTPLADTADEVIRAAGLRRMRIIATSLLCLAALVFLAVHLFTDVTGFWGFVEAASEAAMVGALADWFAVTALFRHPLGIPIPHTAIIPRKKDVLGESLSTFVAINFLKASTVAPKIKSARVTARFGAWLAQPDHQKSVVDRTGQGLTYVLARVDDDSIEALTRNVVVPKLVALRKAPVLGRLLEEIVRDGAHHHLVDLVVEELFTWLAHNPRVIEDLVVHKTPDWMPNFVNDTVSHRLHREVLSWIAEVRDDPSHKARIALDAWLIDLAADLGSDSTIADRAEVVLNDLLVQDSVVDSVLEFWSSLKNLLRSAIADEDGEVHARITQVLTELSERMRHDEDFAGMIDERLASTAGDLAESFGPELASVISDTIAGWDAKEASDKIELYVGKDLQYIRINGTVIGALAGMAIHAVTLALPG